VICSWNISSRYFEWNFAIAMRTGVLRNAINNFKYRNRYGWRNIFGRVLVGFLDDQEDGTFADFDLIVASPTWLDPDGDRDYDHTRDVILAADAEADGRWPFDTHDPPAIVQERQDGAIRLQDLAGAQKDSGGRAAQGSRSQTRHGRAARTSSFTTTCSLTASHFAKSLGVSRRTAAARASAASHLHDSPGTHDPVTDDQEQLNSPWAQLTLDILFQLYKAA
jgi:hypothetical protein